MTLRHDTAMPDDSNLFVPQEITLSTPWLKAVAVYMNVYCEKEANEFMLLRREYGNDPRKVVKEGAALTACGINFLRELHKACPEETNKYAICFHKQSRNMYPVECRRDQWPLDICVNDKLGIRRPPMGHFSKLHVHESKTAKPELPQFRDYRAEAAKTFEELPEDWKIDPERYRKYRPIELTFFPD